MSSADREMIIKGVEDYCRAMQTQEASDFFPLWAEGLDNFLISIASAFHGTQAIYDDFIIGRIRRAYSKIALIASSIDVRPISGDTAAVLFQYETDCIRRESREPYGIAGLETRIWVRQGDSWKLTHVHYSKK